MELRVLHYFLAVAREQSISAAAQSLHLTQPTLSTQLKALEEELGKQLLVRGTKGSRKVILTEEGMILRKRAEEILTLVNKAEEEIAHSDDTVVGTVSIEKNEYLSHLLSREGIQHNLLNAKNHEKEAEIVAQAGKFGAVTVATNMAGRGTDIMLAATPSTWPGRI